MKFRKKPVIIEAVQLQCEEQRPDVTPEYWPFKETPDWLTQAMDDGILYPKYAYDSDFFHMEVSTLEGKMLVSPNDWIIRGVNGELYPCKPDIFEKTYERVDIPTPIDRRVTNGLFTTKYTEVYGGNEVFNALHNFEVKNKTTQEVVANIHFQEGPIKECGTNGVANEDLLLMVITRLQMFQDSPYECRENAVAITKLEEAAMWLRKRTMDREVRGVEGTHTV